jgi:hypothetical protein
MCHPTSWYAIRALADQISASFQPMRNPPGGASAKRFHTHLQTATRRARPSRHLLWVSAPLSASADLADPSHAQNGFRHPGLAIWAWERNKAGERFRWIGSGINISKFADDYNHQMTSTSHLIEIDQSAHWQLRPNYPDTNTP